MTEEDRIIKELSEISRDDACRILSQAAAGQLTLDDEFKAACRLGVAALRESELFWP